MCGIFGLVSDQNQCTVHDFKKTFSELFLLSESRGKEAAGMAMRTPRRLVVLKEPRSASELLRTDEYHSMFTLAEHRSSLAAIGHSRLVTNGHQTIHDNNQPVIKNGFVGIHNGIIVNGDALWKTAKSMTREYDIDTEALLAVLKHHIDEGRHFGLALHQSFLELEGNASIAVLFNEHNNLLLATNNGSLYFVHDKDNKIFVFGSERYILKQLTRRSVLKQTIQPDQIQQLKPWQAGVLNIHSFDWVVESIQTKPDHRLDLDFVGSVPIEDIRPPVTEPSAPVIHKKNIPQDIQNYYDQCFERSAQIKRCTKCLLPTTMPYIEFDGKGVCNFCRHHQPFEWQGESALKQKASKFKRSDGNPDCIVSLSGGRDSCYALHYVKEELGMTPVAYTYDWGMVTDLARRNQARMCGKLGVEHIIVSADITQKRANIRKNVTAWLKRPSLGTIPLFMAGDKQYFYYAEQIKKQTGVDLLFMAENAYEKTNFKTGFSKVKENKEALSYNLSHKARMGMMMYYGTEFLKNPAYINSSMLDSFWAYLIYFWSPHDYLNLFSYLQWREQEVNDTLLNIYDWELSPDTTTTWRIGDGTAAFYNYIYLVVAGFTENDTFRSNQIREGVLSREQAWDKARADNRARYDTIQEYCSLIGLDCVEALRRINQIPVMYGN